MQLLQSTAHVAMCVLPTEHMTFGESMMEQCLHLIADRPYREVRVFPVVNWAELTVSI